MPQRISIYDDATITCPRLARQRRSPRPLPRPRPPLTILRKQVFTSHVQDLIQQLWERRICPLRDRRDFVSDRVTFGCRVARPRAGPRLFTAKSDPARETVIEEAVPEPVHGNDVRGIYSPAICYTVLRRDRPTRVARLDFPRNSDDHRR
jgi:hypothetical protein